MRENKIYRICLLPGDGIGSEVVAGAVEVLQVLPLEFAFTRAEIGYGAYQKLGTPLPDETLEAIRASDAALFGAVTTPETRALHEPAAHPFHPACLLAGGR
jgi:isocitrate/isopropylmalate dehydrogenase